MNLIDLAHWRVMLWVCFADVSLHLLVPGGAFATSLFKVSAIALCSLASLSEFSLKVSPASATSIVTVVPSGKLPSAISMQPQLLTLPVVISMT